MKSEEAKKEIEKACNKYAGEGVSKEVIKKSVGVLTSIDINGSNTKLVMTVARELNNLIPNKSDSSRAKLSSVLVRVLPYVKQ